MKHKILSILIFLLLLSSSLSAQEIIQENKDLFKTEDIRKSLKVYPQSKVSIRSALTLSGKIKIETRESELAELTYIKRAKHNSKSSAIDFIDIISVEFEVTHDGLRLDLRAPNPAPWSGTNESGSIEIFLILPEFCDVEFDTPYFDIDAEGPFNSFVLPESFGKIYIENVVKNVEVVSTNQKVTARNLSGEIFISTTNATIQLDKIYSPDNKIELRNSGGDIKVSDVVGELNIKNSYARIDIRKFHAVGNYNFIRSSNGPILVEIDNFSTDKILITNSYEDIEILVPDDISSQVSLAVEDGSKIEVSDILTKPDFIQKNRLDLIVGDGTASINSSVRGKGNIYFRGFSKGE